jgi:thymidylate kinase
MVNQKIILVEGLPGTGKSSVMEELCKKHFVVYEFHTKRKKITKQFGACTKGKRADIGNKEVKKLEDQLEEIILNSRFMNEEKENIKLKLLTEKMKECLNAKTSLVFKEGFLGCLIDENSEDFLDNLKKLLASVDSIIFLKLSDKQLYERQLKRLGERKGEYDDTTTNKRHKIFIKQFTYLTKDLKVYYVDANPSPKDIVKKIEKLLSKN